MFSWYVELRLDILSEVVLVSPPVLPTPTLLPLQMQTTGDFNGGMFPDRKERVQNYNRRVGIERE